MPIDVARAADDYVEGAKAKVDKLIRNYTARTDKIALATSDTAQKAYVEGVTDPVSQKLRLVRLKELSDADLNRAMEEKGRVAYPTGVELAKDKYARHFEPFAREIDAVVPKLKPKTRDARTNVLNRVVPIAVALQNKKRALLGL